MCKCNNGKTVVDYLTPIIGGTADSATYQLNMTHYLCGNRKVCANGYLPVSADLRYSIQGAPQSLGNGAYCCEVLVTGTCTYMPYRCGGNQCGCCDQCPVTDNIYTTMCVPCASAVTPTITGGVVLATPTDLRDCCTVTNAVAITTSFNVATTAGASTTTNTTASGD